MFKEFPRVDIKTKLTGSAKYADDIVFPHMVYGAMVRSSVAHGDILSIDTAEAVKMEGVLRVITHADIPGIAGKEKERPVLAKERVRFIGEGVAIVVATSQQVAREAAAKVRVSYEELPGVFGPVEALEEGAPAIHGESNLEKVISLRHGDIEKGWEQADVILDEEVSTHRVQHVAIEPESAVADWQEDHIEVYCPSKSPFNVRRVVSETLGIQVNQVRLISSIIGGSFGGKDYDMSLLGSRVALVSRLTGRPAKMTYNREESITEGTKRHPYKMRYKIGAREDGTLTALKVDVLSDAGAYLSKSAMVGWRSCVESSGPYLIPNVHSDVSIIYTNQIYSDALRGFGSPQVDYGIEVVMDKLARTLGMDPLALRRKNALKEGDEHATGQILTGVSIRRCLDVLEESAEYQETRERIEKFNREQKGSLRRGFGISALHRGEALGAGGEGIDTAGVNVHVEKDGSILIYCGLSEVGQGCQSMMVRIVSEMLGVSSDRCRVSRLDTDYVPDSGPTVASRGTVLAGNATVMAVEVIKEKLHQTLSRHQWFKKNAELVYEDGTIHLKNNPEVQISFDEAIKLTFSNCDNLYGNGWWAAPKLVWNWEEGQGDAYFSYVYGACGCELEVDLDTGKTRIIRFLAVHDVGTALNIEEVYGQICGGVAMGIGYGLMEEVKIREGRIQNLNLDSYLIPTAMDIGHIEPVILQQHSSIGPLGAKGLGEPVTSIVAPAITNAISDALGTQILELPADLEHVLAASRREVE